MTWIQCSVSNRRSPFLFIAPKIAPLSSFLVPHSLPAVCTISLTLRETPWRSTSKNPHLLASYDPHPPLVGAGFFFVKKKDNSLCLCIDYHGLIITVKNKYPLRFLDSMFAPLHQATLFSKLDLHYAYHLVRIRKGNEWKTVFNTPLGHSDYLVMFFGFTNTPAVFQALVNVLRDMLSHYVFVYLDDILIFSRTPTEYQCHVRSVLQ